ncbi:hypothetical protein GLOIN_2v1609583, partial [Rhizophagus irregularis DAOM 181602=DAOM 197198]
GNKVIDDFISYTLTNGNEYGRMIFVPYDKFKNIELIGEEGFRTLSYSLQNKSITVALKKLNNSKNINSKGLNEFDFVNVYYDLIFVMPYYNSDLTHYITKDFYNISWYDKIHLHSGNILLDIFYDIAKICDLGTSKSATENDDNNDNEEDNIYGIIPYVTPEEEDLFEINHNTELIIEICDGLRPPIITNAPRGFINLMKKVIRDINYNGNVDQTKIIKSSDIGPVTTNNPGAVYKSRYLSDMIKSAASTRSLKSNLLLQKNSDHQRSSNNQKFEDNNQSENNFDNGESIKKIKLIEDKNNGKERISQRVTRQMARVMQNSESHNNKIKQSIYTN